MLPYTGTYAQLGVAIENGLRLALEQSGGKCGGREVELHRQMTSCANAFLFFDGGEVQSPNFPRQSIQGTGLGAVFTWKKLTVDFTPGYALSRILPDQDRYRLDARAELSF
jgi:hypothetical protein